MMRRRTAFFAATSIQIQFLMRFRSMLTVRVNCLDSNPDFGFLVTAVAAPATLLLAAVEAGNPGLTALKSVENKTG